MDPDATYERWRRARRDRDIEEAADAHDDLAEWLGRGGFEPRWTEKQRAEFMNYGGYSDSDWGQENPTSDAEHLRNTAIAVGGAAVILGIVGYFVWRSESNASAASSPSYPTTLGSGGSSAPVGTPASSTGTNAGPPGSVVPIPF